MRKGKNLEEVIHLIQNSLVNNDTIVSKNKKLKNASGNYREFDVLIESKINELQIVIAIECKDYKKPVAVEKVEAFNSKCSRIPIINKKIMISPAGFQKDAISAAEEFGIDIYEFKNLDTEVINNWIIKEFYPIELYIVYDHVEIEFSKTPNEEITNETIFTFPDFPAGMSLSTIIKSSFEVYENLKNELDDFFHSNRSDSKIFQIKFSESEGLRLKNNIDIVVKNLECRFHFRKQNVPAIKYEEIKSNNGFSMAKIATYFYNDKLEWKVFTTENVKNEKLTIAVLDKFSGEVKSVTNYNIEIVSK